MFAVLVFSLVENYYRRILSIFFSLLDTENSFYVCMYVCMCMHVCVRVCVFVYLFVCVCVFVFVCKIEVTISNPLKLNLVHW